MIRMLTLAVVLGTITSAAAWDVKCEQAPGVECTDPYDNVRHSWDAHPRAEHRALFQRTLELSGLPVDFQLPYELTVFSGNEPLTARVREFPIVPDTGVIGEPVFATHQHESVAPVRRGATRRRVRPISIPGMSNLPDFAYTLWDWASGNEHCPPDPANFDPIDCHNYETHIGWLNSNHMVPQSRKFYEHLHRLARDKARRCKQLFDAIPALQLQRFAPYVRECEKMAIVLEAVGQHYLQDSWASGHMWERWGGPETSDFGNDRALGFVVAALTGLIHGGKAAFDDTFPFSLAAPWDDPMNAPFATVAYVDPTAAGAPLPGVGDIFLPLVDPTHADPENLRGVPPIASYDAQRRSLLGCAVDGVREVYGETAQLHGPMAAAATGEIDTGRRVGDGSCWDQRVTNAAIAAGCGVHQGRFPSQHGIELNDAPEGFILLLAETRLVPLFANAPLVGGPLVDDFRASAAYACTMAQALARDPALANGTEMASGGMPAIAGIQPNSFYARGDANTPPASWADPFPPWSLNETDQNQLVRKRALNLTFADANVAERCADYTEQDLLEFRQLVADAKSAGDPVVLDARCGQCVQQVAPHLRFGVPGNHDSRREALCTFAGPTNAAFVFTEESPASFTGSEPTDLDALNAATKAWCGCGKPPPTLETESVALGATVRLEALFPDPDIVASNGNFDFSATATVTATLPATTERFDDGRAVYTGSGTSTTTRTVTRTADDIRITFDSRRSVDLSVVFPNFSTTVRVSAGSSDRWCTQLPAGIDVEWSSEPAGLDILNRDLGDFVATSATPSGRAALPSAGTWCFLYGDINVVFYGGNSMTIEGPREGQAQYTVTLRGGQ